MKLKPKLCFSLQSGPCQTRTKIEMSQFTFPEAMFTVFLLLQKRKPSRSFFIDQIETYRSFLIDLSVVVICINFEILARLIAQFPSN